MSKPSTSTTSASRDTPTTSAGRGTTKSTTSGSAKGNSTKGKGAPPTGGETGGERGSAESTEREPVAARGGSAGTKRGSDAGRRGSDAATGAAGARRKPWQPVGAVVGRAWRSLAATRVAVAVLAVILAGALGAGGYAGWRHYQHRQDEKARKAAVSAAETTVSNFMSISTKTVDHDLKRVLTGATGDFRTQFKNGMGQTKTAVVENKVTSKAHVKWAGVVTSKRRSATVLVAMDATVKNTNAPKGRLAHYRVKVTMAEQNGRWLVSELQFV
ncbi:hypothetical protein Athai_53960 [Actinocatenispora thailandica]|uniref:Mce-associated membrane protein n=1 Tax=Actinocatenispora thailandica TaxID=227318 RepID=A0A7R7HZ69_9ACTN|nr:hypothetical protein [Actinocatenispora thailandica]BCJ37893.1 hypothetical protein Athai_53960 [Actinocatenispora thailandica]